MSGKTLFKGSIQLNSESYLRQRVCYGSHNFWHYYNIFILSAPTWPNISAYLSYNLCIMLQSKATLQVSSGEEWSCSFMFPLHKDENVSSCIPDVNHFHELLEPFFFHLPYMSYIVKYEIIPALSLTIKGVLASLAAERAVRECRRWLSVVFCFKE